MDNVSHNQYALARHQRPASRLTPRPLDPELADEKKKQILNIRKRLSDAYSDLFDRVEDLRTTSGREFADLKQFLRVECGLSTNEIKTLEKFNDTLGKSKELLKAKRVAFDTIYSLTTTDETTRQQVLRKIEDGATVHRRDVSSIKRHRQRLERSPEQAVLLARKTAMRKAAIQKGNAALTTLESNATELYGMAVAFSNALRKKATANIWGERLDRASFEVAEMEKLHKEINALAAQTLALFSSLFTVEIPPEKDWAEFHFKDPVAQGFAEGRYALEHLAQRRFALYQFAAEASTYYSWSILGSLRFLAGTDADDRGSVAATPNQVRELTSVELCAGAGGEAIGVMGAGFHPLRLYENSASAAQTLKRNWPDWNIHTDDIRAPSVAKDLRKLRGAVDLLSGGLPCQPVSRMGKRRGRDDARQLFTTAQDLVAACKPKAFFFETVGGFLDGKFTEWRDEILRAFASEGYQADFLNINAKDFGLSQSRERVIIFGVRQGYSNFLPAWSLKPRLRTVGESAAHILFPHRSSAVTLADPFQRAARSAQQVTYDQWASKWLSTYGNETFPTVVIWREKMTTADEWKSRGIDADVLLEEAIPLDQVTGIDMKVPLTIPLLKCLQGIPGEWVLSGNLRDQATQVGNAFPPVMARAVAHFLRQAITRKEIDYSEAVGLAIIDESRIGRKSGLFRVGIGRARDPQAFMAGEWHSHVKERDRLDALDDGAEDSDDETLPPENDYCDYA